MDLGSLFRTYSSGLRVLAAVVRILGFRVEGSGVRA